MGGGGGGGGGGGERTGGGGGGGGGGGLEKKKKRARGVSLFPSSPARFLFFRLFYFDGIPSGSLCGGESKIPVIDFCETLHTLRQASKVYVAYCSSIKS